MVNLYFNTYFISNCCLHVRDQIHPLLIGDPQHRRERIRLVPIRGLPPG